jgi:hypothetical protein
LRSIRTAAATGTLGPSELRIDDYDDMNGAEGFAAIKEPAEPSNKDRHGVVSAAQTGLTAIAQEVAALS